jgi:hypothetical protein
MGLRHYLLDPDLIEPAGEVGLSALDQQLSLLMLRQASG